MTSSTAQGPGASDLGKNVIKTRKVTHWQPSFSLSGAGEPGTDLFQLVLDHGASEVVLTLTESDADSSLTSSTATLVREAVRQAAGTRGPCWSWTCTPCIAWTGAAWPCWSPAGTACADLPPTAACTCSPAPAP